MAQRSVSSFKTTKDSRFADNSTGQIEEVDHRDTFEDVADSFLNKTDHLIDDDTFATASSSTVPSSESTKAYVDSQVGNSNSVDTYARTFEDFNQGPIGHFNLSSFNNGGGIGSTAAASTFGCDATEKCSGVLAFGTSTSTAGGSALTNTVYKISFGFGFQYTITFRAAMSALSDGTDTFKIRLGFADSHSATPTNGAYFRYTHGTNAGKWEAVTVSGGTETAEDTGVSAEASVYHIFKIIANSDATQIDFYIDGVKTNDITTNIINTGAAAGQVATIEKTAGSTARTMYVDYYEFITERTTSR